MLEFKWTFCQTQVYPITVTIAAFHLGMIETVAGVINDINDGSLAHLTYVTYTCDISVMIKMFAVCLSDMVKR